jgi:hypothetical protein
MVLSKGFLLDGINRIILNPVLIRDAGSGIGGFKPILQPVKVSV